MHKVYKIPIILGIIVSLSSFVYGGIYNEMIVEGLGISLGNILWALGGSLIPGFIVFFISWRISYMLYKTKELDTQSSKTHK